MIDCPKCGKEISGHGEPCPNCGYRSSGLDNHSVWTVVLAVLFTGTILWMCDLGRPDEDSGGTATTSPADTLARASDVQVKRIRSRLNEGFDIRNVRAVKSEHHPNAWYVGANLYGPGVDGTVAVWFLAGDKSNPGPIYSVDSSAQEFSNLPSGRDTQARTSSADREAQLLEEVLE